MAMHSSSKVDDTYFWQLFLFEFIPILELLVKFASQIWHENINKPLDGAHLTDFSIDIIEKKLHKYIEELQGEIMKACHDRKEFNAWNTRDKGRQKVSHKPGTYNLSQLAHC